ncbi:MAG: peptide chain release factor N(5)-glutamine methyltransferase [Burkholderiales bacterium]|nr:peptide chain release factor N(5)-glutamine methyltransferase [Burkholderiales bacterium]
MTVAEALRRSGLAPREARLLLAAAAGLAPASLVARPERELAPAALRRFLAWSARRAQGEPVAYLLGRKAFYDLELEVDPAVLVPRPETELLVELALERLAPDSPSAVLDLGTGSGAVALAVKRHRPRARVVAVDASERALAVARRNAARLGLTVDFRRGSWFEPVAGERFDLVLANPPYVAEGDPHLVELRYEPREALVAGADGLEAIRKIAGAVGAFLVPGGWCLLEHGAGQAAEVRELLARAGLRRIATWPDLAGIGRVSGGTR